MISLHVLFRSIDLFCFEKSLPVNSGFYNALFTLTSLEVSYWKRFQQCLVRKIVVSIQWNILQYRQVDTQTGDVERIWDARDAVPMVTVWTRAARESCAWSWYVSTPNAWETTVVTALYIWKRYSRKCMYDKNEQNTRDWWGISKQNSH